MTDIQWLPIDRLYPHPDNPRLQLRDDVVERLTAEIRRHEFRPEHAILVRPYETGWQIVSGHHRVEAAARAGITEVPAWVRDMDDDEAFMQLVLGNTQGELSPLEIGMHAWLAKRWDSVNSLKSYADRLGISSAYVGQLRNAADVIAMIRNSKLEFSVLDLGDRAKHLYEISKAPRETWPALVDALVRHEWTVAEVASIVKQLREFNIPSEWQSWLQPAAVMRRFLADNRFDAGKVARIIRAADNVLKWIADNADPLDADEFTNWLHRQGENAWDAKKIDAWLVELIGRVRERKLTPEIRAGDFRDVLADLPDASVDLILTDPPYGDKAIPSYEQLAEFAARKLKPGGSLICYTGQSILPDVLQKLGEHLRYWWTLSLDHRHGGQQLPGKWVMVEWKPIVWFVRDYRGGDAYIADKVRGSAPNKEAHEWAQGVEEVFHLIEQLTNPDDLVVDPFAGSGSFGRAALTLGRRFIGADLDPDSSKGVVMP